MKKIVVLLLILNVLNSCKDKGSEPEAIKSTLEYLSGTGTKKWMVTAGKVNLNGAEVNLLSQPPCITDNILALNKNFTYELSEGATNCKPGIDPDIIVKSTWSIIETPKSITIDKFIFFGYSVDKPVFAISKIDDTAFIGETNVKISGKDYLATITFSAIK